jgi:hypothetical protein
MGVEKIPPRYVVHVPTGVSVTDAVAAHRDRTGHGGMCFLVFDPAPRESTKH